jgi:major type 1 subunit fimbrin (pilin)
MRPVLIFIHSQTNRFIASHTNPDDEKNVARTARSASAGIGILSAASVYKPAFISLLETFMKSFLSTVAAAATLATIALASTGANAADGTITFTGSVTDTTCSIDAKVAGSADKNVTLRPVTAGTLASKGQTAGTTDGTDLTFALSGCSTETKAVARFVNGPTVDQTTGYLENQAPVGGATNVQVRLLNASRAPINIVTGDNNDMDGNGVQLVTGAANLKYFAEYYATGKATAGPVNTSVQYTFDYQ